ncbi:MAG: hypothetical protein J6P03_06270 [Opitutales bacterium]|nr:hypothetical protein [Opitutales bacterium]
MNNNNDANFVFSVILWVFLFLSLIPNIRFLLRDKDEYFSDYRNKIDISYEDFLKRYWAARILWLLATFVLAGLLVWILR